MYYIDLVQEVILNIDGVFLLWSKKDVKFQFECTNDVVMSYMRIYIISCVKMTPVLLARNYFRLVFTHIHIEEKRSEKAHSFHIKWHRRRRALSAVTMNNNNIHSHEKKYCFYGHSWSARSKGLTDKLPYQW